MDVGEVGEFGFGLGFDDEVEGGGEVVLGGAEGFANEPFEPVSLVGFAVAAGGGDSEAGGSRVRAAKDLDGEEVACAVLAFASGAQEVVAAQEAPPLGKGKGQTVSRLRPWRRRRLSTLRPAAVAMRERKPWVFFRRRLLG